MDTQQFEAMLSDAEIRLRRVKVLYDQWFVGIERTEPAIPKKELEDLLLRLRREQPTNTALKFRLQQIVQRHVTFTQYWRRIARQIEEGTFKRDLVRARSRKKRGPEDDANANYEIDVELDLDMDTDLEGALADAAEASERVAVPVAASPAAALAPPPAASNREAPFALPTAAGRPVSPGAAARLPVPPAVGAPKPPQPLAAGAKLPAGALPAIPPAAAAAAAAVVRQIKGPAAAPAPAGAAPAKPPPAAAAPARPQAAAAAPRVVAAASAPGNGAQPALSSEDVQRIYSKYVAARKQNAERTDNVKLDNIEKTLRGMLPSLEKKHAGKKIDFEVVVKDGKVALKPVAK